MSYKNPTIELDFGDLGEGCHVSLINPQMAAYEDVLRPDGDDIQLIGRIMAARFVKDWLVWDRETGKPLPVPCTTEDPPEVMRRVPAFIAHRIDQELGKGLRF